MEFLEFLSKLTVGGEIALGILLFLAQILVEQAHFFFAFVFVVKYLNDLLSADGFLYVAVDSTNGGLLCHIVFRRMLANVPCGKNQQRHEKNGD